MGPVRSLAKSIPIVVLIGALTGCSLAIDAPDPQRPRNEVPKCDTGKGAVGMDGLMTTILGVASLAAFANDESGTGLALGAMGGLFLASAVRGNTAANECRAAFTDYNLAYQQNLLRDDVRPTPVPVVAKQKPKPKPTPDVQAPVEVQAELDPPTPPTVKPETYASPRPPPAAKKPVPQQPPAPKQADEDDWSDFWTEAP